VCSVKTLSPNPNAVQRFQDSGPVALLPLWKNYNSIVWSVPPEKQEKLLSLSDEDFMHALNSAFYDKAKMEVLGRFPEKIGIKSGNFELPPLVEEICTKRFAIPLTL
jgi:2-polyprenyl-6-methoxyphenol hydroxylase-like FAD-dependent oxidoreductase